MLRNLCANNRSRLINVGKFKNDLPSFSKVVMVDYPYGSPISQKSSRFRQNRAWPSAKFYYTNTLLSHPVLVKHFGRLSFSPYCAFDVRPFSTQNEQRKAQDAKKEDEGSLKVDQMLKTLKDELKAGQQEAERIEVAKESELERKKLSIKEKVWKELVHYYHGFRLFFIDLKVSTRLLWRVIRGGELNRQEKIQLVRSAADLFRLVPFLVFIIVPFMEFLLPVYLKLFPGALPSTFMEKSMEQDKFRKQFKVKMEMAKFLQETVEELALERKKKGTADSKIADFVTFLKNIREGGGYVSNVQLLNYSKLFEDELTLDNLSEAQLRALCRIVGMTPIGTANILRFQLSMKLDELKRDDRLISKEGVENLSIAELQSACRARGMRAIGLSEERLRQQLIEWLELSFNEKVPPSLLLLSRTLYLSEGVTFSDRLKALLSNLPGDLSEEAKSRIAEAEGAASLDNKSKYELVKSIEEIWKRDKEAKRRLLAEQQQRYAAIGQSEAGSVPISQSDGESAPIDQSKASKVGVDQSKSSKAKNDSSSFKTKSIDKELKSNNDSETLKGLDNETFKNNAKNNDNQIPSRVIGDRMENLNGEAAMSAKNKSDTNL